METLEGLREGEMKLGEPMKNHTSLRIGGPADIFALPRDLDSLRRIHTHLRTNHTPFLACGGGTNILVRDGGIDGAVICLGSLKKISPERQEGEDIYLAVEAGVSLWKLVNLSGEHGFSGLEGLAGIPGTVGGAICGNAGSFGYEMKDVLVSVQLMDSGGGIRSVAAKEIGFGYRSSGILKEELLLSAELKLRKDDRENVASRIENFLKIKREKQPIRERSAGCVFKNPPGLSAGRLIDEAGCKGPTSQTLISLRHFLPGNSLVSHVKPRYFIHNITPTFRNFQYH